MQREGGVEGYIISRVLLRSNLWIQSFWLSVAWIKQRVSTDESMKVRLKCLMEEFGAGNGV